MRKMNLNLAGLVFSDELRTNVGAAAFELSHDWFTQQDLVIRTAAAGGGTLLVLNTDYQLSEESVDDATKGVTGLSTRTGKNVYHKVQVINATYQSGNLYFSGKYVADSVAAADWNVPILVPQAWLKNLAAKIGTTLFTGTCNTDVSMALKDTTKNFSSVAFGDIVRNTTSTAFATVLYKSGTDTLFLDADIFPAGTEAYAVYAQPIVGQQSGLEDFIELTGAKLDGDGTKTADTNTPNHLLDADGTVWTGLVAVRDWAMNLQTGKLAQVTAVAAHDLTLQWDAFPNGNEKYMIFAGTVTVGDAQSPLNGETIPEMNVGGRYFGGGVTAGIAEDDTEQSTFHQISLAGFLGFIASGGTSAWPGGGTNAQALSGSFGPTTDGVNGDPRATDHTQPRTVRATMIMRIK